MADTSANGAATAAATAAVGSPSNKPPHSAKPKRPNYNVIHADPLPVVLYHSPTLIPHNPISLLHHLYLYFFPPVQSHKVIYIGVFSPVTMSVEIRDPTAVLDLWNKGFWGKGSLSRSEPTWLNREMRRLGDTQVGETSEEITRRRRDQRKEMKKERARKEKEELQKIKEAEAKSKEDSGSVSNGKPIIADSKVVVELETEIKGLDETVTEPAHPSVPTEEAGLPTPPPSSDELNTSDAESKTDIVNIGSETPPVSVPPTSDSPPAQPAKVVRFDSNTSTKEIPVEKKVIVQNQEHLQLMLSEAFFLAYALGILSVTTADSPKSLSLPEIFKLFLRHSIFPPLPESSVSLINFNPDNSFLINYVVYHHFRSLGWVVKSGVKFSVDYLLYKRGPVFSHAEFAILIIPSYSRWEGKEENVGREWHWLHSITRVNSQVKKTVVLVYVDVPTADEVKGWDCETDGLKTVLGKYKIREVALRRWIPGRNRE
ncbi:tRNA splicing endonuclease subunit sen2 [Orbilia oligospora]|uniref:tRNA-splicing endonuclease subunit Sen2 n=1 Tax=Orbilia oligospora TaxID=2813651 RepID=A0A7C8PM87_ORBOL|nr:tRNA splicing endonuclease subunit sen2 [Orbilia oligospora]KAF3176957.1 tRNA splicing endonuclease subunit sen2 [Orbilia oligospora]KAF3239617.1 tRNA splicing endonuclease subunit sen2 [Orbilia oligospora]KAF3255423.1 tRNA splicing endonuclease subunit sen2 [Orbilia oligospora]KAF3295727.1 tRNA splicing endonuclease subunit sen2 [Orbilia oligospora]